MAARAKPALTGAYVFMAAKREEYEANGRAMTEMLQLWKALPESERKEYEERATEEQKRYLAECYAKYEQKQQSDGADEGGDGEDEEDELVERVGAEELAVQLPLARVTKIIKLNNEIVKIGRDACFLVAKATEQFLERATWDAACKTMKANRKTIAHRDVVLSMREHPNPESMQVFVEEMQAQPAEPLAPQKKASKKRPAKGAAGSTTAPPPDAAVPEGGDAKEAVQLPPKKAKKA